MLAFRWLIVLYAINVTALGQRGKLFVRHELAPEVIEEYFIKDADPPVKDGGYIKYHLTNKSGYSVLEAGKYSNGKRVGIWEFFHFDGQLLNHNRLFAKGEYVDGQKNGVWTHYYLDSASQEIAVSRYGKRTKVDSLEVLIAQGKAVIRLVGTYAKGKRVGKWYTLDPNGKVVQEFDFETGLLVKEATLSDSSRLNLLRPAVYLGGTVQMLREIARELDYSKLTSIREFGSMVMISCVISPDGTVTNGKLLTPDVSVTVGLEAIRSLLTTSGNWIPAIRDGQLIPTTLQFKFEWGPGHRGLPGPLTLSYQTMASASEAASK